MEQLTTNLEASSLIAKTLGDACPESVFYWKDDREKPYIVAKNTMYVGPKGNIIAPCFTFSELVEHVLPKIQGEQDMQVKLLSALVLGGMPAVSQKIIELIGNK